MWSSLTQYHSCTRDSLKDVIAVRKPLSINETPGRNPCEYDNVEGFSRSPHWILYQRTHMGKDFLDVFSGEIINFNSYIV